MDEEDTFDLFDTSAPAVESSAEEPLVDASHLEEDATQEEADSREDLLVEALGLVGEALP